jgi:hypothetical protein
VGGDRPIGLAIGIVVTAMLVLLPALFVPLFYLFANVHAIVVGTDFSSDTMIVGVVFVGVVITITVCLLLMAAAVTLIGRALSPKGDGSELR